MRTSISPSLAAILCLVVTTWASLHARGEEAKPKPLPFEEQILAFEAADAKNRPAEGGVLFLGSSSIRLWTTLDDDFPGVAVINRGFGGSKIVDSTYYAGRIVIPYKPKTVVVYAGDNDLAAGNSPRRVREDFQALVETVHAKLPDTRILFLSIKPSLARWKIITQIREANALVKDFTAKNKKLGYVDVFTPMLGADGKPRPELLDKDGLHLTRAGYEIWRDAITPFIR